MLNTTTRLAILIQNLPTWEFSWDDTAPQKSRQSVTLEELLPNGEDGQQLIDRAVAYTMTLLVEAFPSLADLKQFVPLTNTSEVEKSTVLAMKVLFRDEIYTAENIQILLQYVKDCNLSGNSQVR